VADQATSLSILDAHPDHIWYPIYLCPSYDRRVKR